MDLVPDLLLLIDGVLDDGTGLPRKPLEKYLRLLMQLPVKVEGMM